MKLYELKEWLKQYGEDMDGATVVLSKDAEGNRFSPLTEATLGIYTPDSSSSGDWLDGEDEEADGVPINAVCLWPTN